MYFFFLIIASLSLYSLVLCIFILEQYPWHHTDKNHFGWLRQTFCCFSHCSHEAWMDIQSSFGMRLTKNDKKTQRYLTHIHKENDPHYINSIAIILRKILRLGFMLRRFVIFAQNQIQFENWSLWIFQMVNIGLLWLYIPISRRSQNPAKSSINFLQVITLGSTEREPPIPREQRG